jgi:hypothetical protein
MNACPMNRTPRKLLSALSPSISVAPPTSTPRKSNTPTPRKLLSALSTPRTTIVAETVPEVVNNWDREDDITESFVVFKREWLETIQLVLEAVEPDLIKEWKIANVCILSRKDMDRYDNIHTSNIDDFESIFGTYYDLSHYFNDIECRTALHDITGIDEVVIPYEIAIKVIPVIDYDKDLYMDREIRRFPNKEIECAKIPPRVIIEKKIIEEPSEDPVERVMKARGLLLPQHTMTLNVLDTMTEVSRPRQAPEVRGLIFPNIRYKAVVNMTTPEKYCTKEEHNENPWLPCKVLV